MSHPVTHLHLPEPQQHQVPQAPLIRQVPARPRHRTPAASSSRPLPRSRRHHFALILLTLTLALPASALPILTPPFPRGDTAVSSTEGEQCGDSVTPVGGRIAARRDGGGGGACCCVRCLSVQEAGLGPLPQLHHVLLGAWGMDKGGTEEGASAA